LLERAQHDGAARADASAGDVFALVSSLAWAADQRGDSDADLRRMLALVTDGLR